jgi:hypothetical protein
MLVVKTGMAPEYDIATAHFPNAMHLTVVQTLESRQAPIPETCMADL